jgi:hypothetical protein
MAELAGHLPLALRLVGRYLAQGHESAAEYLVWLQETPLDALGEGKQRRDQSVPYLLERSLATLDDGARQLLAVAGLLAFAPFERQVLAIALDQPENSLRRPLAQLMDYGFLLPVPGGHYAVSYALIHTYARQRLAPPAAALDRLVKHYTAFARAQRDQGPAGFARLDPERAHILALAGRCAEAQSWDAVHTLVWAMDSYLSIAGYATDSYY